MSTVVRTRSVEFMPLGLSLGTLGCAASWSVFAIYVGDATILIPNILGVALALAQLALYAKYARSGGGGGASAQGDGSVRDGGDGLGGGGGALRGERESARLLDEVDGGGGGGAGAGGGAGPLPYAPPAPGDV
jgi:hypothetical protein